MDPMERPDMVGILHELGKDTHTEATFLEDEQDADTTSDVELPAWTEQ